MSRTLNCVACPLHATTVEMDDESTSYVDLPSGSIYLVREPLTQLPDGTGLAREALLHESIVGDAQTTQMALVDAVMAQWFRGGRVIEDVSASAPAVPTVPTPAGRATRSGLVIP